MRWPWQKITAEEIEKAFKDKTAPGEYDDRFIVLEDVNKIYGNSFHAVHNFNLTIKKNEFIVFVGPSGCGKSTTLRMIAGLEDISSGCLYIDGEYANDLLSKDRDLAMVFQNYALYPNMSVYNNMAFALKVRHFPKQLIKERVLEAAKILEIEDQLNKKPKELSGGQRQRVALGRAIVRNTRLFLMDEPLSNLDAKLRVQMRAEIIRLHQKLKATTIYVTHDQTEAMTMADRIVVMKLGHVQQIGTPMEIYKHPTNKFVASFIGSPAMNFLNGFYKDGVISFANGDKIELTPEAIKAHDEYYKNLFANETSGLNAYLEKLDAELAEFNSKKKRQKDSQAFLKEYDRLKELKQENLAKLEDIVLHHAEHTITVGIRPESITQVEASDKEAMNVEIKLSELLGDEYYIHFDFAGKDVLSKVVSDKLISTGEKINLKINKDKVHLFDDITDNTII